MGSLIERKKRILMATDSELPPWYQRVEYIKASTNAYIDTQYIPAIGDEITVDYMADAVESGMNCLFSSGTDTYQLIALGTRYNSVGQQCYYSKYFASGSAKTLVAYVNAGTWYRMTVDSNGKFETNNASVVSAPESQIDGANKNLLIFRRANGNNPFKGKLKTFTIRNNSILKMNLIPCIRNHDSVAGVYDTISKQFFGSSGTEEFTPSILDN